MESVEELTDESDKKGFGGLSSLASEVEEKVLHKKPESPAADHNPKPEPKKTSSAPTERAGTQTEAPKPRSPSPPHTASQAPHPPPKGSSAAKWLWSIIVIGILIVLFNSGQDNGRSSGSRSTYSPSSSVPSTHTPSRNTPGLEFTKPPVGNNKVLSVAQIRWCIRESIRIEAMRNVIDTNAGFDEFNQIVNAYNSRCGSYQYRQGTQSQASRDIQPYRSQIVTEAIREARQLGQSYQPSYPPVSTGSPTSSLSKKPSAQYTREAQQILINLGYKPGPIDGDYGHRTIAAVKAFQRDAGITQDGWIDQDLLSMLRRVASQQSGLPPEG